MAQYNLKEQVFCGDRRQYYFYDEELYTGTFPLEWAESHHPGTGPKECGNCQTFGFWNGVFIGYCANCAIYEYKGQRGCGFYEQGKECKLEKEEFNELHAEYREKDVPSAFETYLKDIKLEDIGDKDLFDSAKVFQYQEKPNDIMEAEDEDTEYYAYLESIDRYYDDECKCCFSYFGSHYNGGYESY